jgi:hypothetical protein
MLRKLRARLTYANVTSTLALVLAVGGGTAYAATKIGTGGIRNHAVTGAKLATNAVTPSKVKNGSLSGTDIRDSSITTGKIRNGSLLATDFAANQLPAGPKGDPGPPGTSIFGVVTAAGVLTNGRSVTNVTGAGGTYTVTLGQDVSTCATLATLNGGPNGNITATPTPGNVSQITVVTRVSDTATPRAFQFAVAC